MRLGKGCAAAVTVAAGSPLTTARVSPQVLAAVLGRLDVRQEWREVAAWCGEAELRQTAGEPSAGEDLIRRILGAHPQYAGLELLAEGAEGVARIEIRSIGPTSPEEIAGAIESDARADDERRRSDAPTWVIVAIPRGRRDEEQRTRSDSPPTLDAHASAVHRRVSEFAASLGLPPAVAGALELAAKAHDHGKADPRIQAFFRRGIEPIGEPPLAKSVFGTRDPRTSRIAAKLAGLPHRLHHEVASTAILAKAIDRDPGLASGLDRDLALHLVATHHGRARPIPAVPTGGVAPRSFECAAAGVTGSARGDGVEAWLSGDDLQRFWDVIARYGAWGTAYLEAVLMLADRTVSSEGR